MKKEEKDISNRGDEIKQKTLDHLNLSKRTEDEMFKLDIHLSLRKKTVESTKALKKILRDSAASSNQYQLISTRTSIIKRLGDDPRCVLTQTLKQ